MLVGEIPVGFWAFWLAAGFVLYVVLVWVLIRLAVRSDREAGEGDAAAHGTQSIERSST